MSPFQLRREKQLCYLKCLSSQVTFISRECSFRSWKLPETLTFSLTVSQDPLFYNRSPVLFHYIYFKLIHNSCTQVWDTVRYPGT